MPRDYDPRAPHIPKPRITYDVGRGILAVANFGRRVLAPPAPDEMFEPTCAQICRLDTDCSKRCRLMARLDKEEPEWPTPPTT